MSKADLQNEINNHSKEMLMINTNNFLIYIGLLSSIFITASAQEPYQRPDYRLPVANFEKDNKGFYVNKSDEFYLKYMWQSFVALNWPNSEIKRDAPSKSSQLPASQSPVVWETYPQPQEVFLLPSQWGNYPDWENIPDLPAGMTVKKIKALCRGFSEKKDIVLYDINQPNINIRMGAVAPLIDQHGRYVRYQVTMNRSYFDYVRENQYYDANVQQEAVNVSREGQFLGFKQKPEGAFVPLPIDHKKTPGMVETKAAWRILDAQLDDPSRYYTRPAYILSSDKTTCNKAPIGVGLVALHIHRITRLSHVASTFEQVDNVNILDPETPDNIHPSLNPGISNLAQQNIWPPYGNRGFSGPLPSLITAKSTLSPRQLRQPNNISRATEIPPAVRAMNREFQGKYKKSVLRYYQMINVQHVKSECQVKLSDDFSAPMIWQPSTCPQPNTHRLINAALESYTQLINPFTDQPYNYSCRDCHSQARPCGFTDELSNALTFKPEFMVMSYLLSKAKFAGQLKPVSDYSCNNPATQPFHD